VTRLVVWSRQARAEYLAIIRHIAGDNPDAAERLADRFDEAAAVLADFATGRAGRVAGTYDKVLPGLPYILAYEILDRPEGGEMIAILHLIHAARDWPVGERPKG
jgi:plasmid stabilization system protein ParE